MEFVVSLAIGVLAGSGVWLLLRPRTFQVIVGLALLSYAVNLFILSTGGLRSGAAAILAEPLVEDGALDQREEGVVAAHADVRPGMDARAALADQDVARDDVLAGVHLDAATLALAVTTVAGAPLTLLVSH